MANPNATFKRVRQGRKRELLGSMGFNDRTAADGYAADKRGEGHYAMVRPYKLGSRRNPTTKYMVYVYRRSN